jgi:hypothetical protein
MISEYPIYEVIVGICPKNINPKNPLKIILEYPKGIITERSDFLKALNEKIERDKKQIAMSDIIIKS